MNTLCVSLLFSCLCLSTLAPVSHAALTCNDCDDCKSKCKDECGPLRDCDLRCEDGTFGPSGGYTCSTNAIGVLVWLLASLALVACIYKCSRAYCCPPDRQAQGVVIVASPGHHQQPQVQMQQQPYGEPQPPQHYHQQPQPHYAQSPQQYSGQGEGSNPTYSQPQPNYG